MAVPGVEFAQVSFDLPDGRRLLHEVSLNVQPGTTAALLGRSGSGKTTLLRTVNALVLPTSGQVTVGGMDVASADSMQLRRSIGYVIQETGLFPQMSIERNVGMALELAGKPPEERLKRIAEMLALVGRRMSPSAILGSSAEANDSVWAWPEPWLQTPPIC
jgi:osmoprotectant transport system ATP-binding protein